MGHMLFEWTLSGKFRAVVSVLEANQFFPPTFEHKNINLCFVKIKKVKP